jgi:orotate phosphoribosyltransferase
VVTNDSNPSGRSSSFLTTFGTRPGGLDTVRVVNNAIAHDTTALIEQIKTLAVVRGKVTLSSGRTADYYIDLRRVTMDGTAAPIVGRVMRSLVADWDFAAVGGLTLGADPVATAMLHAAAAAGARLDAFVVRKQGKAHGLQQRIEGSPVAGRRVLAVEDTSTTGASVLTAVEALREAGAEVIGVATIVDRNTGAQEAVEAAGLPYRAAISTSELGLE